MLITPVYWSGITPIVLTYVASTADSTYPMTLMSGINAGDLLVFFELNGDNDPPIPTAATPSGWTAIGNQGTNLNNYLTLCASYKIASGSEDGTNITGMVEDQFWNGIVLQYRAQKALTSLSASTPVKTGSSTDPAAQTITASSGVTPVLGIVAYYTYNSDSVSTRTHSVTADHEFGSSHFWLKDYIQESSPANYTFDMIDEGGDNCLFGFYLHNFNGSG